MEKMFYIRDARQNMGNCVYWWRPQGAGYTTQLNEAGKFTEAETRGKRDTDVPVPCEVADAAAVIHVRADSSAMYPYGKKER